MKIHLKIIKNAFYFMFFPFSLRKNGLIRRIRLISKFMTSQPGYNTTIIIHTLPNISQSKGNQKIKLGKAKEHNKRNIFFQKSFRKWGKETSSRPLSLFQKSFIWCKNKWTMSSFKYIAIVLNLAYNKNKLYKTLDYWSRYVLKYGFLDKDLGIACSSHLVYDFSRKIFLMLYATSK